MKFSHVLALATAASAFPALQESNTDLEVRDIEARQRGRGGRGGAGGGGTVGSTANEFVEGGCKNVIMIFARGSTERGNMGTICGPQTANGVKAQFSSVAVQGVDYAAGLATNTLPGGADPKGIDEMKRLIAKANTECPDSMLVVGGYSQGAAVTHRAVESLPQAQQDQIVAAFMFGDTQFQQEGGEIANFDNSKTNIICAQGDAVCRGSLTILPAHLSYGNRAAEQADFINQKLTAAGARRK